MMAIEPIKVGLERGTLEFEFWHEQPLDGPLSKDLQDTTLAGRQVRKYQIYG